ncbi:hypothetical protein Tco_1468333 [Tanacetum coccineum]
MESQSETTQTVSALKLPILKTGDYDLWSMRMEQYLTHADYALWEVIMNGDAPAIASASTEGPIPPKTAEQKLAKKNELKAKSTLFGGNKESNKMQKTILKQQYENFTASRSEGLDKTYDRFQKLISQLEIHGYEHVVMDLVSQLESGTSTTILHGLHKTVSNIAGGVTIWLLSFRPASGQSLAIIALRVCFVALVPKKSVARTPPEIILTRLEYGYLDGLSRLRLHCFLKKYILCVVKFLLIQSFSQALIPVVDPNIIDLA